MPVKKIKAEAQKVTIVRVDVSTEVGDVGADVKERDLHSPVKGSHSGSPSFARRSPKSRDHRAAPTRSPIGGEAGGEAGADFCLLTRLDFGITLPITSSAIFPATVRNRSR